MTISEQIQAGFTEIKSMFIKPDAQAALTQVQADLLKAQTDLNAANAKAAQAEGDLAAAKQTISTLTGERDAISAQLTEANAKLANPGEQVKKAASAQAAAIVAASGHTAIAAAPEVKTDAGAKEREAISKLSGVERAIAAHKLKNVQTK